MKPIKRTKQEMDRLIQFKSNNTYKCQCGHSVVIYPTETKRLCTWCNHYAYKQENDKFVDDLTNLLKRRIIKMNKEEMEQTIKGLYENQETAIKLLNENVELKKRIIQALELTKKIIDSGWDYNTIQYYAIEQQKILEGDKNDN